MVDASGSGDRIEGIRALPTARHRRSANEMLFRATRLLAFVLAGALAATSAAAQPVSFPDLGLPLPSGRPGGLWAASTEAARSVGVVPEPATFALLAFSFLALRRRPR
jgi:hypothetical protein